MLPAPRLGEARWSLSLWPGHCEFGPSPRPGSCRLSAREPPPRPQAALRWGLRVWLAASRPGMWRALAGGRAHLGCCHSARQWPVPAGGRMCAAVGPPPASLCDAVLRHNRLGRTALHSSWHDVRSASWMHLALKIHGALIRMYQQTHPKYSKVCNACVSSAHVAPQQPCAHVE